MNLQPPQPVPAPRGVPALGRAILVILFVLAIGVAAAGVDLVFGRVVPWGERARVEVWATLAMPMDIERAFEVMAEAEQPQPPASSGARLVAALRRSLRWTWAWAWQAEVEIRTDVAALMVESLSAGVARLPKTLRVAGDRVPVSIDGIDAEGRITVTAGGEHTVSLSPGEGADFAIVPAMEGNHWTLVGQGWRACIEERLQASQPVGRLSIVNHGLGRDKSHEE